MIAIVDYDTGNLRSVENAVKRLGAGYILTGDREAIADADHVLLPGVGEAGSAMAKLRESGLAEFIPQLTKPVLGICIGMQLMCLGSEEGNTRCMGIFDSEVKKFNRSAGLKVPHMGWNTIYNLQSGLFEEVPEGAYVYYVHSYAPEWCSHTIAETEYPVPFSAALASGNFYGTQFHPEKSGSVGEKILANFLKLR